VISGLARRLGFDTAAWAYLWGFFSSRWPNIAALTLLGVVQSLLFLPTLNLVRYAFDHAIPQGRAELLIYCGLGLLGLRLAASGLTLLVRAMSLGVTKAAICEMRLDLITTLYALPRDFFGRNDAARTQTRIVMETERLDNIASSLLSGILPAALTSLCLGAVLLHLNPWLVLLVACVLPLMGLATVLAGRYVKREVRAFQQDFEGFSHGVQFVLRQMDLTRIRGHEDAELSRQTKGLRRLETSGVRMAMSFAVSQQVQSTLTGVGGLLLLVGGGIAVINGAMSFGSLMAFYLAAGALNAAFGRLTGVAPDLITGDESLRKLRALSDEVGSSGYGGNAPIAFKGAIALQDVDFAYDHKPVLRNVSLALTPGSRTAIIGSNGAGKSTIINLILGFYRPTSGVLTADHTSYDSLDLRALRRQIGVVMQNPTFFTGTIAENLTYGWPGASREDMTRAAALARADSFIDALPDGYDTLIGEGGFLISGGQAQRLAIARALIGRPKLLILDEPTNHLDSQAVTEIMSRITAHPDHAAILTISHDMAVLDFADTVLQLKAGALKPWRGQPVVA